MRNQLLAAIFQEVIRINDTTDHAAFMTYSGHVGRILVVIAKDKKDYCNWIWDQSVFFSPDHDDPILNLQICLDHLKTYS